MGLYICRKYCGRSYNTVGWVNEESKTLGQKDKMNKFSNSVYFYKKTNAFGQNRLRI